MTSREILNELKSLENKKNQQGTARFGILGKNLLGITNEKIREIAKKIKKEVSDLRAREDLAEELWRSEIHEARILAAFIAVPELITEKEVNKWVHDFDSWAACDSVCLHFICRTKFARKNIKNWAKENKEYVRRTAFTLMACLTVHDKNAIDKDFEVFFPLIKKYCADERNFVRKAVNWALRQIGKRNLKLNEEAVKLAEEILKIGENKNIKSTKWIANNALVELKSPTVQNRLKKEYNKSRN